MGNSFQGQAILYICLLDLDKPSQSGYQLKDEVFCKVLDVVRHALLIASCVAKKVSFCPKLKAIHQTIFDICILI